MGARERGGCGRSQGQLTAIGDAVAERRAELAELAIDGLGDDRDLDGDEARVAPAGGVDVDEPGAVLRQLLAVRADEGTGALARALAGAGQQQHYLQRLRGLLAQALGGGERGGDPGRVVVATGRGGGEGDLAEEEGGDQQHERLRSCRAEIHSASTPAIRAPSGGRSSAIAQKITDWGVVRAGQIRAKPAPGAQCPVVVGGTGERRVEVGGDDHPRGARFGVARRAPRGSGGETTFWDARRKKRTDRTRYQRPERSPNRETAANSTTMNPASGGGAREQAADDLEQAVD